MARTRNNTTRRIATYFRTPLPHVSHVRVTTRDCMFDALHNSETVMFSGADHDDILGSQAHVYKTRVCEL